MEKHQEARPVRNMLRSIRSKYWEAWRYRMYIHYIII